MNKGLLFCIGMLMLALLTITGCDIIPPECYLQTQIVSWDVDIGDNHLIIQYRLRNVGSINLENCQVRFGIDEDVVIPGEIAYNYTTPTWWPAGGINLDTNESSGTLTCHTEYTATSGSVDYVGIYAVGFDNPPDEE